jgi:intracellular sulfur oxidation DsrE/DsrF family protein
MILSEVHAAEPSFGPIIDGYGPTHPIDDRNVPLQAGFVYRAVFDALEYEDEKSLNTSLGSIARYLNMHGQNGVPVENMKIAVVAHGPALRALLTDTAYRTRFGIENPNTALLDKLASAGVHFYVCGQSMAFGNVAKEELSDIAKVALSAMTMLTVLQSDGYALLR